MKWCNKTICDFPFPNRLHKPVNKADSGRRKPQTGFALLSISSIIKTSVALEHNWQLQIGQKLMQTFYILRSVKLLEYNKHGCDEAVAGNIIHPTPAFLPILPPPVRSASEPLLLDPHHVFIGELLLLIRSAALEIHLQKLPNFGRFWAEPTTSWSQPSLLAKALSLWIIRSWLSLV